MESKEPLIKCGHAEEFIVGVEYDPLGRHAYDGISEWRCSKCGRRWGRWTGDELFGPDKEPKYGLRKIYPVEEKPENA